MLRFYFGASGAGKSTGIFQEIIKRSFEENDKDFLIIVPDQFTMQTQKDVVRMHPSRAIMNIDVLSFGRLSHRIFEEVGLGSFSVLDDVGKSLILRRVSDILGDKLPVIGTNMHKPGYIDEVKSTISEFMQYGIGDEDLAVLEKESKGKGALGLKLKDLRLLYSEFHKYIEGKFITTEETLDILCSAISKSELLKNSVIAFDGFTGFTPIQYKVIGRLLQTAKEVVISLTIGQDENPYDVSYQEQELFMLTKKTVRDLERIEREVSGERGLRDRSGDVFLREVPVKRLADNKSLSFLEKNLFRYGRGSFEGKPSEIEVFEASTPAQEIRQTMIKITDAIRNGGYAYRDIAIVCGNLEEYAELLSRSAGKFGIPVYIDQNTGLMFNPFIEYLTSAVNIVISNYKYEDVFHYMRSGMTDFSREDTDLLENYVRALGIRGQKQWEDRFSRRMPKSFRRKNAKNDFSEQDVILMNKLEQMRCSISEQLKPLFLVKKATAKEITKALLTVIENNHSAEKLQNYKEYFNNKNDLKKAREYDQIYDKIITLLEQIMGLIGEDELELTEYKDILNAGFGEIEVGTIPQDADRVIVGDIERTRLKEIKLLFFMGTNDGAIPKSAGTGGILSDIDRQFLSELGTGVELAPTPRQQMYIQRLYLYMNLTKPTDKLVLSYSELSNDGKSLRPAYLIPKLCQMYPELVVERPEDGSFESQNVAYRDSLENMAELSRKYASDILTDNEKNNFFVLYDVLGRQKEGKDLLTKLTDAAFMHYESKPLAKSLALAIYGANLENSVSRLEQFASCCYAHFLKYGLRLEERKEYNFEASDLGSVFHEILEKYTSTIISRKLDWRELSSEESDEILNQALSECVDSYGETILRSSARNQFMVERIRRILSRTVDTLKYQITKGKFNPAFVEMDFREAGNIDEINIALRKDEKEHILESIKLQGRIDRVDLNEDDDHVYVKVIDFKSGKKKFNVAALYYGLQLQLVMYMNVAMAVEKKISDGKDVVPAAVLYYHVDDPMADGSADLQIESINEEIRKKLKMTGIINDNMDVVRMLDEEFTKNSDIIPVTLNSDGTFSKASQIMSSEDYSAISAHVDKKIREFGTRILDGDIQINPYDDGDRNSCTFCAFRTICGYDEKIPGYEMRRLDLKDAAGALDKIRTGE